MIAQEHRKKITYANMSSLSIAINNDNYFNDYSKNEENPSNGLSFGINTIHGVKFFEIVSVSAGIAIDWNINKTFVSTPYIVDFRLFSSRHNETGLFVYIQTGNNIKWSDSFAGNGVSAKLGIGFILANNDKTLYYLDVFKKSLQIETSEFDKNGYYNANGFGFSLGIIFK